MVEPVLRFELEGGVDLEGGGHVGIAGAGQQQEQQRMQFAKSGVEEAPPPSSSSSSAVARRRRRELESRWLEAPREDIPFEYSDMSEVGYLYKYVLLYTNHMFCGIFFYRVQCLFEYFRESLALAVLPYAMICVGG